MEETFYCAIGFMKTKPYFVLLMEGNITDDSTTNI